MGRRHSIYVINRRGFRSPPSPNATLDQITTEIRLFYPPNADPQTLVDELGKAYVSACRQAWESDSAVSRVSPPSGHPERPGGAK